MSELASIYDEPRGHRNSFGFAAPRASSGRTVLAIVSALILGVWLSFGMQAIVQGIDKVSERYGWQELYEMANESRAPQPSQTSDLVIEMGSKIMRWAPLIALFILPCIIFFNCCYKTRDAGSCFVRLRYVFLAFILTYMVLGSYGKTFTRTKENRCLI